MTFLKRQLNAITKKATAFKSKKKQKTTKQQYQEQAATLTSVWQAKAKPSFIDLMDDDLIDPVVEAHMSLRMIATIQSPIMISPISVKSLLDDHNIDPTIEAHMSLTQRRPTTTKARRVSLLTPPIIPLDQATTTATTTTAAMSQAQDSANDDESHDAWEREYRKGTQDIWERLVNLDNNAATSSMETLSTINSSHL